MRVRRFQYTFFSNISALFLIIGYIKINPKVAIYENIKLIFFIKYGFSTKISNADIDKLVIVSDFLYKIGAKRFKITIIQAFITDILYPVN